MKRLGRITKQEKDVIAILDENLKGEEDAIRLYKSSMEQLEKDGEIYKALLEICNDEEDHHRILSNLIKKYSK